MRVFDALETRAQVFLLSEIKVSMIRNCEIRIPHIQPLSFLFLKNLLVALYAMRYTVRSLSGVEAPSLEQTAKRGSRLTFRGVR